MLNDSELEILLNFVGYGNLKADVWFLGMEEAGGGEENLRLRLKFRLVEDCAEAHQILGITQHHTGRKVIQPTWRGMSYIMLAFAGKPTDKEHIRNYQADLLGRFRGNSLLCELLPIPKPSIGDWEYKSFIPQFKSAQEYYRVVMPRRIKYLRSLIEEHKPKSIICYGKSYWNSYKELFGDLDYAQNGQFLVARTAMTRVLFTDHFTSRTMNGKFDEVAALLRS